MTVTERPSESLAFFPASDTMPGMMHQADSTLESASTEETSTAPPLALDKSFAHGASGVELIELAERWTLIVPSAFYWEIFTTEPIRRVRTVQSLPEFRRVHLPNLLNRETEDGTPAISVETPRLRTNSNLSAEDWRPTAEEAAVIECYKKETVEPALGFWKEVMTGRQIPGFSDSELSDIQRAPEPEFEMLCKELRDLKRIRDFSLKIEFSHASKINRQWLHFRQFQAWLLHAFILLRRHRESGDIPNATRMEHDVQDIEYLILGLHCGGLATGDDSRKPAKRSLAWRLKILEPAHVRISPLRSSRPTKL